jgi:outer membrane protein assembly factor BamB/enterochelin esterase-like enzyme
MTNIVHRLMIAICLIAFTPALPARAEDAPKWTQFRGSSAEGPARGGELPEGKFGLRVQWTRALGSGYSNIWATDDGRAVTMFNEGEADLVAAFDLADGRELWRYRLGDKYSGHDGSDDGPIGTPTVSDGVVYALGPAGGLVALSLADGSVRWRRELNKENSTVPFYGYTTSPIVAGKHVILATGGEGHAVTAFDRATGEPKWTSGDDSVSYQTPMVVNLGGRTELLTVTNKYLQGLDPAGGKVLWQLQHTEGNEPEESAHPTVLDDGRFLIKYGRGARLYRRTDGGVEEVWRTRAFGNGFALPVLVGDHLYGFSGTVLTCVAAGTGEIVWRSREVSGLGLAAVDGSLAILSLEGELVLADASPEGYREISRVPVFEDGNYAIPTFHDGRFFLRNLEQLAAVRIDTTLAPRVAALEAADRLLGDFGQWVGSIEALPEPKRQAAVEARFGSIETTPLFGPEGLVHFVWRGEAEDVGVTSEFVEDGRDLGLHRLEGSDLFFRSMKADPKAQYTYTFSVDFGDPQPDPRNPHKVDNGFGVVSELRMPDWPASPFLDPPPADAPRGTLDRFPFRSTVLANARDIQVWRPAGYGQDPERRYPLLVVNHGDNLLRGGLMQNALDNLVGKSVAPIIAVFVPRASGAEYGGPAAENYVRFLTEELLPHLDRHYLTDPAQRAIMGPGSAGVEAMLAAFTRPDVFRKVAALSFYPIEPTQERLPGLIAASEKKPDLAYVVWSRHDYELPNDRTAAAASAELLKWLRDAKVNAIEQVADYSPGWGGWRGQYDEILPALFPVAP